MSMGDAFRKIINEVKFIAIINNEISFKKIF